ncbi:MAG: MqnA/MqnD/SBP family protein [Bryobacterales bacterium]|nr:ABC transporter substrate-binding protein [Bryobacteraceae bacterium]MDW8131286.1 MqnA/MqnD/SBP family protein [Bryobacterales bacterium]
MAAPSSVCLTCAHTPDSDDAYMFYALATRKIRSALVSFTHVLADIETLNARAGEGAYDMTAISYHAWPYVADRYVLMASGSSMGDGYGPLLVSMSPLSPQEVRGKRIAVPGRLTSSWLALKLFEPDFQELVVPFDKVLDALRERVADAALLIHEAQLTYASGGFHRVLDLGTWWKQRYGLPLPLGATALLRSLPAQIQAECCRLLRESILYAFEHHEEALNYAMQFARDMDMRLAEKFVSMYVNDYTLDVGETGAQAAQKFLDLGWEAGLIPRRLTVEFVR